MMSWVRKLATALLGITVCLCAFGDIKSPGGSTSIAPGTPVQGYDTPLKEGAAGNGIANDTTALQTCVTTGACYMPPGYTYLITSTITVPTKASLLGAGITSTIKGSSVSGPCIQVGTVGPNTPYVHLGNFHIAGGCTTGIQTYGAYSSKFHDILEDGNYSLYGFAFDHSSFCLNLDRLIIDGSVNGSVNVGTVMAFSAAVGGASTGTISSGNPGNGSYMMVFLNGEVRRVTVSGSTATWTGNIAAGNTGGAASFSTTSASYGAGFFFGSGENCIVANVLESVNNTTTVPFAFELEDVNGYGQAQAGDVFNTPVAENCQVCYFFGSVTENVQVNGLYCEQCVLPILAGEAAGNYFASGIAINGANISSPTNTATGYANRYAVIDVQAAYNFVARNIQFAPGDSTNANAYPLTFSGGTQTTAPKAYAIANANGVIKTVAVIYPGDYTTGNPPTGASCSACSGSPTFTIGTTGTTPFSELGVFTVNVTGGGSGNTSYNGYVPVSLNSPSGATRGVIIDNFDFGWGITGSLNISALLAYDSVNASGFNRSGVTLSNDTGFYNAENGGNLFGTTCNHGNENSNREWCSFFAGAGGITGIYSVPVVSFP
jgi:hypothetical protein